MDRIELAACIAALLPLILAVLFRATVVPRRKKNLSRTLALSYRKAADAPLAHGKEFDADLYLSFGRARVLADLDSLYTTRLFVPALLLTFLYGIGLSLGVTTLTPHAASLWGFPFEYPVGQDLTDATYAVLGAYTFNTGLLVRRAFVSDVTKNLYWGSINRLIFSVSFAVAFVPHVPLIGKHHTVVSFSIAFFPKLVLTALRRLTVKVMAVPDAGEADIAIQAVQGIDIWKQARLEEEGIESVQNLATADVLMVAVKTNYPLRTIVDWMDQAILIQRFPTKYKQLLAAGLPVSALDFTAEGAKDDQTAYRQVIASALHVDPLVVKETIRCMADDTAIKILRRLWQSTDTDL